MLAGSLFLFGGPTGWVLGPAAGDKIEDVVLIATPEIIYDSEKDYIGNFYNEAGVPARGYRIHSGSIFSE